MQIKLIYLIYWNNKRSMEKKWIIIIIVLILVFINIFFSLYAEHNSHKSYYFKNHANRYYKKKTNAKIIPSEYKLLKPDLNLFQDYINQNFEEEYEDFENYYFFNLEHPISADNKHCFNLLEKLMYCLSEDNFKNIKRTKCNRLLQKEMKELEKCQIDFNFDFDINDYSKKMEEIENNMFYLNFSSFEKYNKQIEEEESETQEIIIDNKEIETIIKDKKKKIVTKEYSNEDINKNEENLNKDCVEYGLSQDDILICTKYE